MTTKQHSTDPERRAALALLSAGLATLAEVAELARTSRQLVRYWAEAEGIDVAATRRKHLARHWRRLLRR